MFSIRESRTENTSRSIPWEEENGTGPVRGSENNLSEEVEGGLFRGAPLFDRNSPTEFGVPRGNFLKYITLDPLRQGGTTIRIEGTVAA